MLKRACIVYNTLQRLELRQSLTLINWWRTNHYRHFNVEIRVWMMWARDNNAHFLWKDKSIFLSMIMLSLNWDLAQVSLMSLLPRMNICKLNLVELKKPRQIVILKEKYNILSYVNKVHKSPSKRSSRNESSQ